MRARSRSRLAGALAVVLLAGASSAAFAGEWVVERAPSHEVIAVLEAKSAAPPSGAGGWVVAALPPETSSQHVLDSRLEPGGETGKEPGADGRGLLVAEVRGAGKKGPPEATLRLEHRVALFSRRLVPKGSADASKVTEPAPLPPAERQRWLAAGGLHDVGARGFTDWVEAQSLRRAKDEDAVAYARRAFLAVRRTTSYQYPPPSPQRHSSSVCVDGKSDCGGLNGLLVTALRAGGVPARLLVGRWAKSGEKGVSLGGAPYLQWHVKAEFWVDGAGWVPADAGLSIPYTDDDAALAYFGQDGGEFLTMHAGGDLRLDLKGVGPTTVPWMQGFATFGSLGAVRDETWTVFERR